MPWSRVKTVLLVIDSLVYLAMLGLGFFFIYKGDVLQRFQLKRTNFAVFEEPITELPTIKTYIDPYNGDLAYLKDFWIVWRAEGWHGRYSDNRSKEQILEL